MWFWPGRETLAELTNPLASDRVLLERIAREHDVPPEALLEMIDLELSFHRAGRRRGLFPKLREIVSRTAGHKDIVRASD